MTGGVPGSAGARRRAGPRGGRSRAASATRPLSGVLIVGAWLLVAALAPVLAPHSPLDLDS